MATSAAVTQWDAQGNPIGDAPQPPSATEWDAQGNPVGPQLNQDQTTDARDALVYSHLLQIPAQDAYQNRQAIHESLMSRVSEYAAAGWRGVTKDSIIAEYLRGRLPEPFQSHDEISQWIESFGQMVGDLPEYLLGAGLGFLGGAAAGTVELPVVGTVGLGAVGAGAGGFALTEGLRQWLVDKYAGNKVSAFKEVWDVLKAGGKGALTGGAMGAAGEATPLAKGVVGKFLTQRAYKTAAELATMSTVGPLLEGRLPTKDDFVRNAAMFAAMHVGTLGYGAAKDYLSNNYVRSAVHPAEVVADPDRASPPMEEGTEPTGALRPAIKTGDQVEVGEPGETHDEIEARQKPEKELAEPKESTEEEKVEEPEPERGFVDPKGNFLDRQQAADWVKENEPEIWKAWDAAGGGEFHTEAYNAAAEEVHLRGNTGEPSPNAEVSVLRRTLNGIQKGSKASKFGTALRSFFVGNRDARIAETNQLADSLRKLIPDYRDQEALTLMRDFKGREDDLRMRRDRYEQSDNPRLKKVVPIIDRALSPSREMTEANDRLQKYFESRLEEGKRLGFIDSQISSDQYITHLLRPESEGDARVSSGPSIGRRFRFAQERKYETTLDALETGTVKAHLNALDALTIYGQKHATAAATKVFINELKKGEIGKWGYRNSANIPADWVELAPGSNLFRNVVPYIDKESGEAQFAYQSLMVPKQVHDAMRPIIEGATITGVPGFSKFKAIQAYLKAAELSLSVFHMKALSITALNNQGVTGLMRSFRSDMESQEFKDVEQDAVRHGMVSPILGRTAEAYRAVQPSTFPSRLDVIRQLPGFKQADAVASELTRVTFDILQRKFKVMDYSGKVAAWMAKHPEADAFALADAKQSVAKEVNAAYGGLNWEVLGASKNFRNIAQAILLAPDWTFSNFFNAKYAFEGGPAGAAARMFWTRSILTGMAMTQAMSLFVSGQPSKHPSEVYLGKDKDGREVYGNMFFAGAPKDFITLLNNVSDYGAVVGLAQSIGAKLSPVFRAGTELVTNRDWMGRQIVKKGTGAFTNTALGAWHLASDAAPIPFSISNVAKMLTDPDQKYGYWDYVSVIGGSPPRHEVPAGEKRQATRKQRFSIRGAYK